MKVLYSPRGRRRATAVESWWRQNRRDSPDLFRNELNVAFERLMQMGEMVGAPYVVVEGFAIRRYALKKTHQTVFYSVDREEGVLRIHSVWGTARGKGPPLP